MNVCYTCARVYNGVLEATLKVFARWEAMNDVELLSVLREPLNKPSLSRDRRHSGWSEEHNSCRTIRRARRSLHSRSPAVFNGAAALQTRYTRPGRNGLWRTMSRVASPHVAQSRSVWFAKPRSGTLTTQTPAQVERMLDHRTNRGLRAVLVTPHLVHHAADVSAGPGKCADIDMGSAWLFPPAS